MSFVSEQHTGTNLKHQRSVYYHKEASSASDADNKTINKLFYFGNIKTIPLILNICEDAKFVQPT